MKKLVYGDNKESDKQKNSLKKLVYGEFWMTCFYKSLTQFKWNSTCNRNH